MSNVWAELWTRPGDANFGRIVDDLPFTDHGLRAGLGIVGSGNGKLPSSFTGFDSILLVDQATPANSASSLVRLFSEQDPTTPFYEWIPDQLIPATSKTDYQTDVLGKEISTVLAYGRIEPFDWDGTDDYACTVCDWVYGGNNVLSNPGLETSAVTPIEYFLDMSATGGTFTLSDGVDTTAAIAWNAGPTTIILRLETDISAITDVTAAQYSGDTYISFIDPAFGVVLTIDTSGLTGGTAVLNLTQAGTQSPSGWTRAQPAVSGLPPNYGNYDAFEVSSAQARTGSYSLLVNPGEVFATSNRNGGAQQIVAVQPGQTYQASIWVFPTSGTDLFRLGVFTIGGSLIAYDANGVGGAAYTASTWNQITISDIEIPADVDEVIYRLQCTNGPGNPSAFYIDDAELNEGLTATTPGAIVNDLYQTMVDVTLRDPIVWDDGSGTDTPYLTLDFNDTVDSAGNAWFDTSIKVRFWMRQNLGHVLSHFSRSWGYEWRVVPDDVEAGTWLLQMYNPGGMKTDYTSSATPAIQGGAADVRRSVRRYLPDGTDVLVEGLARLTSRDRDDDLLTALGRIEAGRIDRELPSLEAVIAAAYEDKTAIPVALSQWSYNLVDPADEPMSDYLIGDLLTIHDPPEVEDDGRLTDVVATFTPGRVEWQVEFAPATGVGS